MNHPTVPVFLNERTVNVPAGTTLAELVAREDPTLADALSTGTASATDARALPIPATTVVTAGAIYRVARSARTTAGSDD